MSHALQSWSAPGAVVVDHHADIVDLNAGDDIVDQEAYLEWEAPVGIEPYLVRWTEAKKMPI